MMTLIEAAVPSFPIEPLLETDLVTPYGFIYLPRPFYVTDEKISIRAIMWATTNITVKTPTKQFPMHGPVVCLYSHRADKDDYTGYQYENLGPDLSLYHAMVYPFHTTFKNVIEAELSKTEQDFIRPLQAIWRLMTQTISIKSQQDRATSPVRKRLKRANFPEKRVTVITLRRPRKPDSEVEHHDVDWTHRWYVEGHWRKQRFPSLAMHRARYINPYLKGPEDKPLVIRKLRVFQLTR